MNSELETKDRKRWLSAFLSHTLLMPGSGHILLGQRLKGYAMGALTLLFIAIPLFRYCSTLMSAFQGLGTSPSGTATAVGAISLAWQAEKNSILICLAGLFVVWIYGIIDLVLLAKKIGHPDTNC